MWWSFVLTAIGVAGFLITGQMGKWWGWWINVAGQGFWIAYAITTEQWGFLGSVGLYGTVFFINARKASREHKARKRRMHAAKQLFLEKQNDGAGTIVVTEPMKMPPVTIRREDLMDIPDLRSVMHKQMSDALTNEHFDECVIFHSGPRCRGEVCEYRSRV